MLKKYWQKLVLLLKNNKKQLTDFNALVVIQLSTLVVSFVTYPYLIRALGPHEYGSVVLVQTVVGYFAILINFGFDLSGARSLAQADPSERNQIITTIYSIKVILLCISLLIYVVAVEIFLKPGDTKTLFLMGTILLFNPALFPQWYFQSRGKLPLAAALTLSSRVLVTGSIFCFVHGPNDASVLILIQGLGFLSVGISSIAIIVRAGFVPAPPNRPLLKKLFLEGFHLFVNNSLVAVKDKLGYFAIAASMGLDKVAIFDFGVSILSLAMTPLSMFQSAFFVKQANNPGKQFLRRLIGVLFLAALFYFALLQVFTPQIVSILFGPSELATHVTHILLLSGLILSVSGPLGAGLVISGLTRYSLRTAAATVSFFGAALGMILLTDLRTSIIAFALLAVCTNLFELGFRGVVASKKRLI